MKNKYIKTILSLALTGVLAVSVAACGSKTEEPAKEEKTEPSVSQEKVDASEIYGKYALENQENMTMELNEAGYAISNQMGYYRMDEVDGNMCVFLSDEQETVNENQYVIELQEDHYRLTGYFEGEPLDGAYMDLIYRGDEDQEDGLGAGNAGNFSGYYVYAEDESCALLFREDGTYLIQVNWTFSVDEAAQELTLEDVTYRYGMEDGKIIFYYEDNGLMKWEKVSE